MWSTNTIPQPSASTRFVPIPEQAANRQSNLSGYTHVYKTPIKQPIFVPSNRTPYQFDFNFYFGNLWSSGNLRMPIYQGVPSSAQSNKDGIMLMKNSVENSGFKMSPPSEMRPFIQAGGVGANQYEEPNKGEGTKKNLSEIFNNVKNEVLIPTAHPRTISKPKNKSKKIPRKENESFVPILCPNVSIVPMFSQQISALPHTLREKEFWHFGGSMQDSAKTSSEGKGADSVRKGAFTRVIEGNNENFGEIKEELKKNLIEDSKFKQERTTKKDEKPAASSLMNMFSSPLDAKKPRKLFECSGSTMNTDSKSNQKKRRFRKNNDQLKMLNDFYEKNKQWTKSQIQEISRATGLKENKVYKWLWDQRNKEYKETKFIVNKDE